MNTARCSCVFSVRSTPRKTKNGSVSDGSGLSRATSLRVLILPPLTPKRSDTWYVSVASSAFGLVVLEVLLVVVLGFVAGAPGGPPLGAPAGGGVALGGGGGGAGGPAARRPRGRGARARGARRARWSAGVRGRRLRCRDGARCRVGRRGRGSGCGRRRRRRRRRARPRGDRRAERIAHRAAIMHD